MISINRLSTSYVERSLLITSIIVYLYLNVNWVEPIEWGLIKSQKILLSDFNLFYIEAITYFSAINELSSYLLSKNINIFWLNLIFYSIINLTSFIAIYLLSKYFFDHKNKKIKFIAPIMFLFIKTINGHGYDIVYPNNYWVLGQFGMYISIITISLYLLNKKKTAFLSTVILLSVHPVWFLFCFIIYLFNKIIYVFRRQFKYLIIIYSVIFVIILIIIKLILLSLEIHQDNKVFDGHNIQIRQDSFFETILFSLEYFFTDILLLIIVYILRADERVKKVIRNVYVIFIFLLSIKLYDYLDYNLVLLDFFGLKDIYIRVIPERFFNINIVLLYVLIFGYSVYFIIKSHLLSMIFLLTFTILCFLNDFNRINYQEKYVLDFIIILSILQFFKYRKLIHFDNMIGVKSIKVINKNFFTILLSIFLIFMFLNERDKIFISLENKNIKEPKIKEYFENKKINDKKIIIGSYVLGDTYNPTIENLSEIIVPYNSKVTEKLFCNNNNLNFKEWYNNIEKCFEDKKIQDWVKIYNQYKIKYLIVKKNWKVNAEIIEKGREYNLYKLKQ